MKKVFVCLISVLMLGSCLTLGTAAANEPVTEIEVPYKSATVDGVVEDGEWDDATALTMNITDTQTWKNDGAGFVGDTSGIGDFTDDDFTVTIKLMYKDGWLYYLETRKDTTPFYSAENFRYAYTQDGTLTWFKNTENSDEPDVVSVFAKNDNSKNDYYNQGAFMVYGIQNNQDEASTLACEELEATVTSTGYVIEAKIDITKLNLTERDLALGNIRFTFCSINVFNPEFDGTREKLWDGMAFQGQYVGVNKWGSAPVIKLVGGTYDTSEPETDPPATFPPTTKPVTEAATSKPADNTSATTNAVTDAPVEENNNTGLIIGIVAAVAVIAVVVVVIIVKKKKDE